MLSLRLGAAAQEVENEKTLGEVRVISTAEEILKQAQAVSTITAEDIKKHPPANDLSEIVRTMNMASNTSQTGEALKEVGADISGGYTLAKGTHLRVGINNLTDKRLYCRDNGTAQGASTYNEPGRSFYLNLSTSF
jgi:outer membrane receptor for ferrienterochelin and colicin